MIETREYEPSTEMTDAVNALVTSFKILGSQHPISLTHIGELVHAVNAHLLIMGDEKTATTGHISNIDARSAKLARYEGMSLIYSAGEGEHLLLAPMVSGGECYDLLPGKWVMVDSQKYAAYNGDTMENRIVVEIKLETKGEEDGSNN